jgi:hypothetical protein
MSQSLRPLNASGASPSSGGSGGAPPSTGDIADEINDHLACRRSELEDNGVEPAAAEHQARRSFGDARRIARQIFWIHHGERIMSQRLLWAVIGLVLVALLANLYMQQRSTAAMNAAIAKLTEQMGRGQPPTAEARIKVVDEAGQPRAGVKLTVSGANPSPFLSNATYWREFESDADGMIRTGPIILGEYKLQALNQSEDRLRRWMVSMEGPGLRLLNNEEVVDVTFTVPQTNIATVTIELAEMSGGWESSSGPHFVSSKRFGKTSVKASGTLQFGKTAEILLLPGADIDLNYQLKRRDDSRRGDQTFQAAEMLSRNDPALLNGGTIRLGLPRNRTSSLAADGKEVRHRPASQPVE